MFTEKIWVYIVEFSSTRFRMSKAEGKWVVTEKEKESVGNVKLEIGSFERVKTNLITNCGNSLFISIVTLGVCTFCCWKLKYLNICISGCLYVPNCSNRSERIELKLYGVHPSGQGWFLAKILDCQKRMLVSP